MHQWGTAGNQNSRQGSMAIQIFDNDDNVYLKWMDNNPTCYVVNTPRLINSEYFVLHRAKCPHISVTSGLKKGAYTTRVYIKIGSASKEELNSWFKLHNKRFKGEFKECSTCMPISKNFSKRQIVLFPDTIEDYTRVFCEGAKKLVSVNSYERNPQARQKCIAHYGYSCSICKIDFEEVYGIIGKDFIHVHHLKEISEIGEEYMVDPIVDLIPVCPNCHAMLHQRKPSFSIEELSTIIHNNR